MNEYTFSVSELFPDGRLLVTTYARVGEQINMVVDVYDTPAMQSGRRFLDVHFSQYDLPVVSRE